MNQDTALFWASGYAYYYQEWWLPSLWISQEVSFPWKAGCGKKGRWKEALLVLTQQDAGTRLECFPMSGKWRNISSMNYSFSPASHHSHLNCTILQHLFLLLLFSLRNRLLVNKRLGVVAMKYNRNFVIFITYYSKQHIPGQLCSKKHYSEKQCLFWWHHCCSDLRT